MVRLNVLKRWTWHWASLRREYWKRNVRFSPLCAAFITFSSYKELYCANALKYYYCPRNVCLLIFRYKNVDFSIKTRKRNRRLRIINAHNERIVFYWFRVVCMHIARFERFLFGRRIVCLWSGDTIIFVNKM